MVAMVHMHVPMTSLAYTLSHEGHEQGAIREINLKIKSIQ